MFADLGPAFGTGLAATALALLACVVLLWLLSIRLRDISIIDIFWGPGFGVVAVVGYLIAVDAGSGAEPRRLLVTILTVVWALRLGAYLWWRNAGKGEDPRYTAAYRNRIARNLHLHTLVRVFLLQGGLIWLISIPVQVAQHLVVPSELGIAAFAGCALWLIGFLFEAIGDWQLARFRADAANRGKLLQSGLWAWTRHPNYFGNACLWWGLWLIACDHWVGLATVFSPLLMTHFLLNVTGKRLLEKRMARSRPDYAEYAARTSGFFPRPPRRSER